MPCQCPIDGKTYLSTSEVAAFAQVSLQAVRDWTRKGLLTRVKRPGWRQCMFVEEEVRQFLTPQPVPIQETRYHEMTPRQMKASSKAAERRARAIIESRG